MSIEQMKARIAELEPIEQGLWRLVEECKAREKEASEKWSPVYQELSPLRNAVKFLEKESVIPQPESIGAREEAA